MSTGELLVVFGPPAVGKTTVGRAVCARSDFRLFHNHHTIEPLHEIFGQDSPAFGILNAEFRRRVIEEAAANDLRLVFTTVWNLAGERDATYIRGLVAPYVDRGLPVRFVELYADLGTRLGRNGGPDRLAEAVQARPGFLGRPHPGARGGVHHEHVGVRHAPGTAGAGRVLPPAPGHDRPPTGGCRLPHPRAVASRQRLPPGVVQ